jgi:23S rRNA (cytosine1962-C5)-methyltransferase
MAKSSSSSAPALILHEDDHLLVINKPPGINTHAVNIDGSAGIYDWLRHREPRWATLATHQRLDKETSGVLLFAKTREANQWLARRFELREVRKTYQLLTDRDPGTLPRRIKSQIYKAGGNDFRTSEAHEDGRDADTEFQLVRREGDYWLLEAIPFTGRTHQIRLHARDAGFPILGDETYGGTPFSRLCLHAHILEFAHPITREPLRFEAPVDFSIDPHLQLRQTLWPEPEGRDSGRPVRAPYRPDDRSLALPTEAPPERRSPCRGEPSEGHAPHADREIGAPTTAWRLIHGASDDQPGWYVDRLGDWLLSQSEQPATPEQRFLLAGWCQELALKGAYHKQLDRLVRKATKEQASPSRLFGEPAADRFVILENGVRFWLSFGEGYSTGLFLDQTDNRRRLLTGHIARDFPEGRDSCRPDFQADLPGGRSPALPLVDRAVLNTFAYTCGFSVCAALAGATVTSLDLSRKYLDWGRDNFRLNDLDPDAHDFIYGDCFDWMKRLAKKGRTFDVVLLDPPTFSQSKASGVFKADKDYGALVDLALPLLRPGGLLFCSTNCATLRPEPFLETLRMAVKTVGRSIEREFFAPQPPDFPTSREEHGYLKTVWLRIG